MSSLKRETSGPVLFHRLSRDELTLDANLLKEHGRTARTLVKEGALRLTLMGLSQGGLLPEHSAAGPVSIHMLHGDVVFTALGLEHPLSAGDVLVFAAGVRHAARSQSGCTFLLTVSHIAPPEDSAGREELK
jgi:quercetin dioxygenase-like cupin family protein